jgi:hypothetical protein
MLHTIFYECNNLYITTLRKPVIPRDTGILAVINIFRPPLLQSQGGGYGLDTHSKNFFLFICLLCYPKGVLLQCNKKLITTTKGNTMIAKIDNYYFKVEGNNLLIKEPNRSWEPIIPIPFLYHRKRTIVKQAMVLLEVA